MEGRGMLSGELIDQALLFREEHELPTIQEEAVKAPGLDTTLKSLVPAGNRNNS
jgi:hypothetical protein